VKDTRHKKNSNFKSNSKSNPAKSHSKAQTKTNGSTRHQPFSKSIAGGSPRATSRDSSGRNLTAEIPRSWRLIAGTHAILECLRVRPKSIKIVFLDRNWSSSHDLREIFEKFKYLSNTGSLEIQERSSQELEKLCFTHQGCIIYSNETPEFSMEDISRKKDSTSNQLLIALDGVEDPHNLGAIMRTAWLMNASALIIPTDRAVGLTATVHKVACGGVEHVPIAVTKSFSELFKALKESGFWIFGLSHKSTKTIYDLKMPEKVLWVLGAEDKGLRTTTERECDELVKLPQVEADASYNVSVAAAMALAETHRQWRK